MLNLFKREIWSRRNAIIGWGIGLSCYAAMYIGIYPEMAGQLAAMNLSDISFYQAMGVEMGSFEAYLGSTVLQFMSLILGIYAIIGSTGALAGEEDSGTLELIVATPIPRWQIVAIKALALAVVLFLILAIAGAGSVAVYNAIEVETDITGVDLFLGVLSGWPITLAFTMIGLFLGAFLPNRRAAALALTAIFIASYFGEGLSGMADSLEPFRPLSLHHYFDTSAEIFTQGLGAGNVALLLGVALVFLVLAVLSFQRRNITVGAWPWQRAQVPS